MALQTSLCKQACQD